MKKIALLFGLTLLSVACSDSSEPETVSGTFIDETVTNKVLLLKVDFLTSAFEGGKELTFADEDDFTISTTYNSPGDFGDVSLNYSELNQPLFAGTIHWMGLGEMTYPESLENVEFFTPVTDPVAMPDVSLFAPVMYSEYPTYPETIDYAALWDAVDNLLMVKEYRMSNPNAQINVFLYTPSVGVGNPAEWDWFIILKS